MRATLKTQRGVRTAMVPSRVMPATATTTRLLASAPFRPTGEDSRDALQGSAFVKRGFAMGGTRPEPVTPSLGHERRRGCGRAFCESPKRSWKCAAIKQRRGTTLSWVLRNNRSSSKEAALHVP
jgi:hypothetical protein